jgi:hypothetical protein
VVTEPAVAAEDDIPIGVIFPFSGAKATYGKDVKIGLSALIRVTTTPIRHPSLRQMLRGARRQARSSYRRSSDAEQSPGHLRNAADPP